MAAVTPSSIARQNLGSVNLLICPFATTAVDDADTWASGLSSVIGYWANISEDPTQGKEGIAIAESSGTFTFNMGENDKAFTLYVLTNN